MGLQKWANLAVVLVLAFFLAMLETSPDSFYKTLKDWQTFLAGIIGFAALAFGSYAGQEANRARDDWLLEREARAIAAALAAEINQHLRHWSAVIASGLTENIFPPRNTVFEAYVNKIGILGVDAARVIVDVYEFENHIHVIFEDHASDNSLDEKETEKLIEMQRALENILRASAAYLFEYAHNGIWLTPPEIDPVD